MRSTSPAQLNCQPTLSLATETLHEEMFASQLYFARRKLSNSTIPFCLRAISYLRISCSVWRKISDLESDNSSIETPKNPYLNLLKSLSKYKVEWWKDCEISDTGILISKVKSIDLLLKPLTQLHQLYS